MAHTLKFYFFSKNEKIYIFQNFTEKIKIKCSNFFFFLIFLFFVCFYILFIVYLNGNCNTDWPINKLKTNNLEKPIYLLIFAALNKIFKKKETNSSLNLSTTESMDISTLPPMNEETLPPTQLMLPLYPLLLTLNESL